MKSKAAGCGSISIVISSIVLLCVSSINEKILQKYKSKQGLKDARIKSPIIPKQQLLKSPGFSVYTNSPTAIFDVFERLFAPIQAFFEKENKMSFKNPKTLRKC